MEVSSQNNTTLERLNTDPPPTISLKSDQIDNSGSNNNTLGTMTVNNAAVEVKRSSPHKRKALTLETKAEIIREVDSSKKQKHAIAKEYGISQSTLSTIYKNKDKIIDQFKRHNVTLKRVRTSSIAEVEEAVLRWYRDACSRNVFVNGPMVKSKAKELAQVLGNNDFKGSNGWLERFKSRHQVTFKACGKEKNSMSSMSLSAVRDWQQHELPIILQQYLPSNIFFAGEAIFLYRLLPDTLLKQKLLLSTTSSESAESKTPLVVKNQDVLTALFCFNLDGTEKEKLLLVGKFPSPSSFKGVKSLPVTYASDKRASMNAILFEKWFAKFDQKMKWQQRKVLLFIDNCAPHRFTTALSPPQATEVTYLPPNTNMYHPLSQGIKQVVKCYYRRRLLQRALAAAEIQVTHSGQKRKQLAVTVRDAADMLAWAWNSVSSVTIASCFQKSGFAHAALGDFQVNLEEYTHQAQALGKLTRAFLQQQKRPNLHPSLPPYEKLLSALEYIDVDEFLPVYICNGEKSTWGLQSDTTSAFVEHCQTTEPVVRHQPSTTALMVRQTEDDIDNVIDKDDSTGPQPPKPSEALKLIRCVRSYFQSQENVPSQVFSAIAHLEETALSRILEPISKTNTIETLETYY